MSSIGKDINIKSIIFQSPYAFIIESKLENCKDEKVQYNGKEITVNFCECIVKKVLRSKDPKDAENLIGNKIRLVTSNFQNITQHIPAGKISYEPSSQDILSPHDNSGEFVALIVHYDTQLKSYVGSFEYGLVHIKHKKLIKSDRGAPPKDFTSIRLLPLSQP